MLRKQPAFTIAAVLTLALGIGAYTAIFSIVNSIALKPLPYPRPEELVSLQHTAPGAAGMGNLASNLRLSASMYFTYAEHTRTFSHIGVWVAGTSTVTGGGDPEEVRSIFVSDGVMPSLSVEPLLGRALRTADQDPGAAVRAVVLGYGFWMRRFGGDPSVVGRTIIVNANSREVVGVMRQRFGRSVAIAGVCLVGLLIGSASAQTTSTTETKQFEVISVDGNQLVIRNASGTKEYTVPEDFRFDVDGKQLSVHDLKPGMKGTATVTTIKTVHPVTVTEVKNGQVMTL